MCDNPQLCRDSQGFQCLTSARLGFGAAAQLLIRMDTNKEDEIRQLMVELSVQLDEVVRKLQDDFDATMRGE